MSAKKTLRIITAIIVKEGCSVAAIETAPGGGSHLKLRLLTPVGPRLLVVSIHEGERRALYNLRADIRRLARGRAP